MRRKEVRLTQKLKKICGRYESLKNKNVYNYDKIQWNPIPQI